MNYQQTIDYLYNQLPMFSRIGAAAYKKDLHNTIELCQALGNPQQKFKSIHVAGTNGKGSTSHMLAAIFQHAGYKTALYTSPHLKDFRERIKINGLMIPEDFVVDFVQQTKALSEKIAPSFFELTVAMAFDYFAIEQVDIAIIETGLGGRLDSTNIITPVLSIITNIGWDHMNILGDSLEKIAFEKAGIIKQTVPVVVGSYRPELKEIFVNKASEENADLHFAQDRFVIKKTSVTPYSLSCQVEDIENKASYDYTLDLNGIYQASNLCTVLNAVEVLKTEGFQLTETVIKEALKNVKILTGLFGRWQVIREHPMVVLDVAHNEDGIRQILEHLRSFYVNRKYHFILGMVRDKDLNAVLKLLPTTASYYFTNAHIPRAKSAKELQTLSNTFNLKGETFDDVNAAINAAEAVANEEDIIVIFGSVFLIGEVAF